MQSTAGGFKCSGGFPRPLQAPDLGKTSVWRLILDVDSGLPGYWKLPTSLQLCFATQSQGGGRCETWVQEPPCGKQRSGLSSLRRQLSRAMHPRHGPRPNLGSKGSRGQGYMYVYINIDTQTVHIHIYIYVSIHVQYKYTCVYMYIYVYMPTHIQMCVGVNSTCGGLLCFLD